MFIEGLWAIHNSIMLSISVSFFEVLRATEAKIGSISAMSSVVYENVVEREEYPMWVRKTDMSGNGY